MQTNNVVVAVIGMDQPGVIACVSAVMTRLGCNIEEMTQSTLHRQFAGIYLVQKPAQLTNEELNSEIQKAVSAKRMKLTIVTRDFEEPMEGPVEAEPFVISVYGPDRNDIVGTFAISDGTSMQVFEVSIPSELDTRSLHRVMLERAKSMGLNLTMQHRDIFEAIHRVAVV